MPEPQIERHEIIIVKRRARVDHGHHGGAWKIAYADFVTAMMAFFLVMWLINAANEKTRAQVASYFNPIKLTDTSTSKKGLNNPLDRNPIPGEEKKSFSGTAPTAFETPDVEKPKSKTEDQSAKSANQSGKYTEAELFANPYGILSLIAGQGIGRLTPNAGTNLDVSVIGTDHQAGKIQFDPFHPYALQGSEDGALSAADSPVVQPAKASAVVKKVEELKLSEVGKAPAQGENKGEETPVTPLMPHTESQGAGNISENVESSQAKKTLLETQESSRQALAIRDQIIEKLNDFPADEIPNIDVKSTPEGILISVTDSFNFDMFSVGSAQPQPQLVNLMEKISTIIKSYDGKIVLRGHTDAKPFRNGLNDNWRLSSSRAQMAFYMLTRAGLDESKIERIEGYADHDLKYPDKPESAGNRRIEILLKAQGS